MNIRPSDQLQGHLHASLTHADSHLGIQVSHRLIMAAQGAATQQGIFTRAVDPTALPL